MDFSSANVPISRETWAPRSPPRSGGAPPPTGPSSERDPAGAPPSSSYSAPPPRGDAYGEREKPSGLAYGGEEREEKYVPPSGERGGRYEGGGGGRGYEGGGRDRYEGGGGGGGGYQGGGGGYSGPRGGGARRPPGAPNVAPTNVLGVFGLSVRTVERELEDEFSRYGDVEKVVVVYDQTSERSRGFGFITMRTVEDATRCIEKLNGFHLNGRDMRVDYSATQKPHNPTPGQYMGERRPELDSRYPPRREVRSYDDRPRYDEKPRFDDRRDERRGGDRYDDRDRYRGGDSYRSRRDEDPYGGRSRRDDDRRRSPSPRRSRYSASPDRKPSVREYAPPQPNVEAPPRY